MKLLEGKLFLNEEACELMPLEEAKDEDKDEKEVDIELEDEEKKDLPDVKVDDMLSLDDLDVDVDLPFDNMPVDDTPIVDVDVEGPVEEVPQVVVTNAKLNEIQNAVRDEFASIDHLKALITTITMDDANAQDKDGDLIDVVNGVIDLKYELIGMLNKGIELLDGETVELMNKGEERAQDILDDEEEIVIKKDEDEEEVDADDVFGAGQELEITDKFDIDRPEDIDADKASAKSLFDIDDEGEVTDELEDDSVIVKAKSNK